MRQDNSESIVRRSVSDSPRVGAYGFGPFRLELAKRTLERDGSQVILPSRAFDALTVLIENRGQVVEKDVLMRLVWPTTNVEENNVAQCMVAIRRALGDHYVATVAGRGYSFTAPVLSGVNYSSRSAATISPYRRQLWALRSGVAPLHWCWPEQRIRLCRDAP